MDKYTESSVEFTGAKEYFNNFPTLNCMYDEVKSGVVDTYVNFIDIIEGCILINKFDINDLGKVYKLGVRYDNEHIATLMDLSIEDRLEGSNEYWNYLKFKDFNDWLIAYNTKGVNFHTKTRQYGDELIIGKVKGSDDTYCLLWMSQTRNNSILTFRTLDSIETILEEYHDYINTLEDFESYKVLSHSYSGWIS